MVKKFLGNCLSFPFKRRSWTSERRIIEWLKKSLILLWIVYFIIQSIIKDGSKSDGILTNVMIVITEYVKKLPFINYFSSIRPVEVLLRLTVCGLAILGILRVWKKFWKYKELAIYDLQGYNYTLQKILVDFLNAKSRFGHNIYWLDGAWGSGKTHFLRTFFQHQLFKKLEIYYVSCFGITSREQAEQVLIREIEERSSLGSLDNIPIINSLVKWGFKTLGLDLMKKDSVVIFDDLERAVYVDAEDEPHHYNDLLGFIDYLANHKNQKVIVVYNAQELQQTQLAIIDGKFKPLLNRLSFSKQKIFDIVYTYPFDKDKKYLKEFYGDVFKLALGNYEHFNLRLLIQFLNLSAQNSLSAIVRQMVKANLLNFPESVEAFPFIDCSEFVPVRYSLLLLEMVQKVERIDGTNNYKIYDKSIYLGNNLLHYGNLYKIVVQYQNHLYEQERGLPGFALLRLYDGGGGQSFKGISLSISNLVFMFNFLHPEQVLNEVSLGEHMKNHFKVEAVPPAPDLAVVYKLTEDFQTVFQSFSHKNARHHVKYLEEWQEVLLELKTELESGPYYNLFNFSALDWPATENKTHLYHMPQGLFEEWDKRNNRLNS